jgi:hypothetical protein
MKNDLNVPQRSHLSASLSLEQLGQEVTLVLPLGVVLKLAETPPEMVVSRRLDALAKQGPAIGEQGLYGIYAGNARGYDDEADGVLEVLAEAPERLTWPEALKWAASLGEGARLPTRKEQALLFANVPELFREEAYWSCEQHDERWAWYQNFNGGVQDCNDKDYELRARAVRRLPI